MLRGRRAAAALPPSRPLATAPARSPGTSRRPPGSATPPTKGLSARGEASLAFDDTGCSVGRWRDRGRPAAVSAASYRVPRRRPGPAGVHPARPDTSAGAAWHDVHREAHHPRSGWVPARNARRPGRARSALRTLEHLVVRLGDALGGSSLCASSRVAAGLSTTASRRYQAGPRVRGVAGDVDGVEGCRSALASTPVMTASSSSARVLKWPYGHPPTAAALAISPCSCRWGSPRAPKRVPPPPPGLPRRFRLSSARRAAPAAGCLRPSGRLLGSC